jgi:dTDP-4-dehydrorhamnose 3,5-epimerase-like enzyme
MSNKAQIIQLPKITDPRGNLTFIEAQRHIPFNIKRVYWIYDVPGGESRGGHAFREQNEFIIALSGSFDVKVDDGRKSKIFHLNRSYFGLLVPAGTWRSMSNFSTNSLALVLASTYFDEADYIREYSEFCSYQPIMVNKVEKIIVENKALLQSDGTTNSVNDCHILELEKNHRIKGNITVIEKNSVIPFNVNRVYYLYDVPGGVERGGHAHKGLYQLIIAGSGSFDVILNDGKSSRKFTLNRPYQGLYVVPGIWRELENFSSGSNCLVLASNTYDEMDYIRDYEQFKEFKKQ